MRTVSVTNAYRAEPAATAAYAPAIMEQEKACQQGRKQAIDPTQASP
ncbi:MAG: hypothetical protein ABIE70_09650 [bacterium]